MKIRLSIYKSENGIYVSNRDVDDYLLYWIHCPGFQFTKTYMLESNFIDGVNRKRVLERLIKRFGED